MNSIYKIIANCPAFNLQNGQVSYTTSAAANGGYSENTIATFMCNYGYNQDGSQSRTCGASGKWDQNSSLHTK